MKPQVPDLFASVPDDKVMRPFPGLPPTPLWARTLGRAAVLALLIGALWILWLSAGCTRVPLGPGDAAPPDAAEPFCCKSELGCTRPDDPGCGACGKHPTGCPCPQNRDCHPDTLGTGWVCLPCTERD